MGAELEAVRLRSAVGEAMKLATAVNVYLDVNAPWTAIKKDKDAAALTVYTALKAIDSLKVLFSPFLPFTCERLHGFFGYETPLFGEQYIEEIQDSLGTHNGLRYRGVDGIAMETQRIEAWAETESTGSTFQKVGGECC